MNTHVRRGDVTEILRAVADGEREAFDRLMPLVYTELRVVAARHMRGEAEGHTLDTVGLVNEAYLKLVDQTAAQWSDRRHFFAIASRAMRQILVDHARRRKAEKRGGDWQRETFSDGRVGAPDAAVSELLGLHDALDELGHIDDRLCRVVEHRFFGGLSEEETAELLGVSKRTVRRDWVRARAWLYGRLYDDEEGVGHEST